MKHLKTFEAINSNEINDLFSLWKVYRMYGPRLNGYKINLDWEREDEIDDHGYTVDYCAMAIDDDGNEWQANMSVDKMSDEVSDVYDENCPEIEEIVEKNFSEYLKSKIELVEEFAPDAISLGGNVIRKKRLIKTELDVDQVKEAISELNFDTNTDEYLYEYKYEMQLEIPGIKDDMKDRIFIYYVQVDKNNYKIGYRNPVFPGRK
jgi:hypothetical protein